MGKWNVGIVRKREIDLKNIRLHVSVQTGSWGNLSIRVSEHYLSTFLSEL